jgi:signal transduction histidine kinase/FixJ family two-component response regulator
MSKTKTLLIVDDCAEDRKIYRRYLKQDPYHSYQILEANSAEDGLIFCLKKQCDVMLVDLCLPDMSGLDFLDRLNQPSYFLPSSSIMLTGYGDEKIAVQAMKRGVYDYLIKKHLKADVLQLAVRNAIEKSKLQTKLIKFQERQRLIATTALRIRQSLELNHILHTAVAEVQQLLQCDRVVIYQFAKDATEFDRAKELKQLCTSLISDSIQAWKELGAIANVYEAGVKLNSTFLKPVEQCDRKANLVVPIYLCDREHSTSKIWGLLIAHQPTEDRQWQAEDLEILKEIAVHLAIAIQQAELLLQTQAALAKEKQLSAFKTQIVTTVSHEYRTPLANILAAASTIKQHGDKLDRLKQQKFLEIIENKARHLSKVVDDLLLSNQIELDKTKFQPTPIELQSFFADLIGQQRETIGNRHELIFKITGNPQSFWGDRGLLRQIFINLISNAIKYSPDGGSIEINLLDLDSKIVFSLKDEGIGIPIEDRENLFQSFFRASNTDTISGTGLGLAITKACVELHGGNISIESQIGSGTTVTVSLPKITFR